MKKILKKVEKAMFKKVQKKIMFSQVQKSKTFFCRVLRVDLRYRCQNVMGIDLVLCAVIAVKMPVVLHWIEEVED